MYRDLHEKMMKVQEAEGFSSTAQFLNFYKERTDAKNIAVLLIGAYLEECTSIGAHTYGEGIEYTLMDFPTDEYDRIVAALNPDENGENYVDQPSLEISDGDASSISAALREYGYKAIPDALDEYDKGVGEANASGEENETDVAEKLESKYKEACNKELKRNDLRGVPGAAEEKAPLDKQVVQGIQTNSGVRINPAEDKLLANQEGTSNKWILVHKRTTDEPGEGEYRIFTGRTDYFGNVVEQPGRTESEIGKYLRAKLAKGYVEADLKVLLGGSNV